MRAILCLLSCLAFTGSSSSADERDKKDAEGTWVINEGKDERQIKILVSLHMAAKETARQHFASVTPEKSNPAEREKQIEEGRVLNRAKRQTHSDVFDYATPSKTPNNSLFIAAAKEDRKVEIAITALKMRDVEAFRTPEYANLYARRLELQAIKSINQPLESPESIAKAKERRKIISELALQHKDVLESMQNPTLTKEAKINLQSDLAALQTQMRQIQRDANPLERELD